MRPSQLLITDVLGSGYIPTYEISGHTPSPFVLTEHGCEIAETSNSRCTVPLVKWERMTFDRQTSDNDVAAEVMEEWTDQDHATLFMMKEIYQRIKSTLFSSEDLKGAITRFYANDLNPGVLLEKKRFPWLDEDVLVADPEFLGRAVKKGDEIGVLVFSAWSMVRIRPLFKRRKKISKKFLPPF